MAIIDILKLNRQTDKIHTQHNTAQHNTHTLTHTHAYTYTLDISFFRLLDFYVLLTLNTSCFNILQTAMCELTPDKNLFHYQVHP